MSLSAGTRIGVYEIVSLLGAGGMGEVYRAHDTMLKRDVALKLLPRDLADEPERRARLMREARMVASLNHPNICTIHEVGEADGQGYIAMELVEGRPLSARLAEGPLPPEEVLRCGLQLVEALGHAHDRGVLHRDLKSANVMITPEGRAKVLDFGLATRLRGAERADASTRSQVSFAEPGAILGTLPYMPPEQLRGEPADVRSDVWALGVVLYEMATATRPFTGATGYGLTDAILHKSVPPLPAGVPPALRVILQRCLMKEPAQRYQSAGELGAALQMMRPPTAVSIRGIFGNKVSQRLIVALAALLMCLAIVSVFLGRNRAARTAGPTTVAVLPFQVMATGEELRFLGVGIPDSIISRLANIKQLVPRPTTSILRYEKENVDVSEVGRTLASEYVLTGIVQQTQDHLRVSVQLVRAHDRAPIWGEHYDNLTRADLLGLQDVIAEQIAQALTIRLSTDDRARLYRRYTENVKAYELYLQGRSLLVRQNAEMARAAVAAFEQALQLDDGYVLARAGLASSSALMRLRFAPEHETASWGERATREAKAALTQDPQLAEAHEALAAVYRAVEYNWAGAIEESRLALELNPNLDQPHYYRATAFYHLGLFDLAEREVQLGLGINPGNPVDPTRQRTITALYTGRFADAIGLGLDVRRITGTRAFDYFLAQAYYYNGEPETAEEVLRPLQGPTPGDRRAQAILASYFAARGKAAQAQAILARLNQGGFTDHHIAYAVGQTHAQLGNADEAVRSLIKAATTGFPCYPWYERDPMLEPLRRDVAFVQFMVGLRHSWEAARVQY